MMIHLGLRMKRFIYPGCIQDRKLLSPISGGRPRYDYSAWLKGYLKNVSREKGLDLFVDSLYGSRSFLGGKFEDLRAVHERP
jgi:hypothetical protein